MEVRRKEGVTDHFLDRRDQLHLMAELLDVQPQWCELAQASSATTRRGCDAMNPSTLSRLSFLRNATDPSARAPSVENSASPGRCR